MFDTVQMTEIWTLGRKNDVCFAQKRNFSKNLKWSLCIFNSESVSIFSQLKMKITFSSIETYVRKPISARV